MLRFLIQFDGLGGGGLHLVGELVGSDARGQVGVVPAGFLVTVVEMIERLDQAVLFVRAHVVDVLEVKDWIALGAEHGALVGGGHVAGGPVLGTGDGASGFVQHDDIAGEVLVHASQSVVDPGTQ